MSLNAARFKGAQYARNLWCAIPEHGQTLDAMLAPIYWAHVAAQMTPGDKIEVRAEDGTWYAELYVVDRGRNWARVAPIFRVDLVADLGETPVEAAEYAVRWRGPHARFSVVRLKDGAVVKEGMLKDEAERYLRSHVKAMAA